MGGGFSGCWYVSHRETDEVESNREFLGWGEESFRNVHNCSWTRPEPDLPKRGRRRPPLPLGTLRGLPVCFLAPGEGGGGLGRKVEGG